jgi:lauroyl/myristoyl acyltransferase
MDHLGSHEGGAGMASGGFLFQNDLSRFLQMPVNAYLADLMPLAVFRRLIHCQGFLYYGIHCREAANIAESVKHNLAKHPKSYVGWMKLKAFIGIFDHYCEKLVNAHRSMPRVVDYFEKKIDMPDNSWLDQIRASGRGALFITGHFGAVEYLPLFLAVKGYRPSIVVRFKTAKLRKVLYEKSLRVDLELIDADKPHVAYQALDAVKRGRLLITLCDEFKHWRPSRNDTICIFGRSAPRDRTLDVLYRRTRSPACFGLMQRQEGRFGLKVHPLSDGSQTISLTDAAWEVLSAYISRCPDQWYQWKEFEVEFEAYANRGTLYAPV